MPEMINDHFDQKRIKKLLTDRQRKNDLKNDFRIIDYINRIFLDNKSTKITKISIN